jgi:carnosine synthase
VASFEEALALKRPYEGSFIPSPSSRLPMSPPADFASPAPRGGAFEHDVNMELDESNGPALQLDTDGPRRKRVGPVKDSVGANAGSLVPGSQFELEQLLASPGSLPRAMTSEEREAAIRSLLPTATHQMLSNIPSELLSKMSPEAQMLRRKLAHGSTVVFITAGTPGKRFILDRAAEMGIKSVVLDHPDSWSKSLVQEGVIAKFLSVDMSQASEQIFAEAARLIQQLGDDGITGSVDAICTFCELSVPLVARLSETFGLPGMKPACVDTARNKHATRAALKAAGLPTPHNSLITSEAEIEMAAAMVGFPAVLKPVSGAASLGVIKVSSLEDLKKSFKETTEELRTLVVSSGALVQGSANDSGVDASNMIDMTMLLEQYLDGAEVDIDVVFSNGKWRYAAVSDNGPTLEPYFNETWAVCPSLLPKEQQAALKDLAVKSVEAIGFTSGVFHVECKMTSTGPQLIEVNARMGGGPVRECNLRTWGVDLVEETIFCALGVPARPVVPKQPHEGYAFSSVNAKQSGRVGDIMKAIEQVKSQAGVVSITPLCSAGDSVVGPADGLPTWLCDICVAKPTAKEALAFLFKLEAEFSVEIS